MSKRLGSQYRGDQSADWIKVKNPAAPAAANLMTRDEARRIAVNIAKLPALLRK